MLNCHIFLWLWYNPETEDILKPNVLKSSVKIDTKLQYTKISDEPVMKSVHEILEKLPCTFERVRFMKLVAGKVIGKHSDKIDKDIESGNIVRIHVPIRTNEDVIFTCMKMLETRSATNII